MFGHVDKHEVLPYTVPEYWDENALSIHKLPCGNFGPVTHRRFALQALEHKLASLHGRPYAPLEQYEEKFDADKLPVGTVIRLRRELAYSNQSTRNFPNTTVAERPSTDLTQPVRANITHRNMWYHLTDMWGIVAPGYKERHTLFTVTDDFVRTGPNPQVRSIDFSRHVPTSFTIGEVLGSRTLPFAKGARDQYQRIIAVDEVSPSGYKRRQPVREFFEKLVETPAGLQPIPIPTKNN